MSDVTVGNSIDGIGDFKLSQSINTPNTVVYFFHGTAPNEMLAKKIFGVIFFVFLLAIVAILSGAVILIVI